jgi:hypothetical protein
MTKRGKRRTQKPLQVEQFVLPIVLQTLNQLQVCGFTSENVGLAMLTARQIPGGTVLQKLHDAYFFHALKKTDYRVHAIVTHQRTASRC